MRIESFLNFNNLQKTKSIQNKNNSTNLIIDDSVTTNMISVRNKKMAVPMYNITFGWKTPKENIDERDIPQSATVVEGHNISINSARSFDEILSITGEKYDYEESFVTLGSGANARKIKADNVTLKNYSKALNVDSKCTSIANNASAKNIKSETVSLYDKSNTDTINSSDSVDMLDQSTANSVNCRNLNLYNRATVKNASCQKLNIQNNSKIWGNLNINSNIKIDDAINIDSSQGMPYLNPFLIKTNIKDFHPNKLKYGSKQDDFWHSYMPETVYFESTYGFIKDYKAKNVESEESIYFSDNSSADSVKSKESIIIQDNAKIKSIEAKHVELKGNCKVKDIYCNGGSVVLTGPVNIEGKIKFKNSGVVIINKDNNGDAANIDSGIIENGIIFNPKSYFMPVIFDVLPKENEPSNNKYKNITNLKENPIFSKKVIELSSNKDKGVVESLYSNFVNETLQSLIGSNKKQYTAFWVEHKKLGDENLTDFWLNSIGKSAQDQTTGEKVKILNNLSGENKKTIIESTVDYYLNSVLPKELNKENNKDLDELNPVDNSIIEVQTEIEQVKQENIESLFKNEKFLKLINTQVGNKSLADIWIDHVREDGEKSSSSYSSSRLKRMKLEQIFNNPEKVDKIIKLTLDLKSKDDNSIKTVRKAYKDLLENESELNEPQKKLLTEYQDSKLFYSVVTGNLQDKEDLIEIETNTIDITKQLVQERKDLEKSSRDNIFNPVRNIQNIYLSQNDQETQDIVNFIFSILKTEIEESGTKESNKARGLVTQFKDEIKNNSDNIQNTWMEMVDKAQKYYETAILDNVTNNNIKLLFSMNNNMKDKKESSVLNVLEDKTLSKIEEKEFISRYKNDYNFKIMIGSNGVNKKEAIDSLLYVETINKQVFKNQSAEFINNINPDSVKTNEELANRFISILGKNYYSMDTAQKTDFLNSIAPEELALTSEKIYSDWEDNDLATFMSTKFIEIQQENNIDSQGKNIVKELKYANNILNKQLNTLEAYSENFNNFAQMSLANQEDLKRGMDIGLGYLSSIDKNTTTIQKSTTNIEKNTKALVRCALKDVDPKIRDEITSLLPEEDQSDLSVFLAKVDKLAKEEKDAKRKKQLLIAAGVVATVVTVGAIAYVAAPALLATSGTAIASTSALSTVSSANVANSAGSLNLLNAMHTINKIVSFGLSSTMEKYKKWCENSGWSKLEAIARKITESTTINEVKQWIKDAGIPSMPDPCF